MVAVPSSPKRLTSRPVTSVCATAMESPERARVAPIAPGERFVYEFQAAPAGSYIYHTHVKLQQDSGLYGPLIIEEQNPHIAYDREYTLVLDDYLPGVPVPLDQLTDGAGGRGGMGPGMMGPGMMGPGMMGPGMMGPGMMGPGMMGGMMGGFIVPPYAGLLVNGRLPSDPPTFEVRKGETFAFLGPNGAGKTTTIKMLTTVLRPTSGTLELDGLDPVTDSTEVRKRFGVVFQDPSLDSELTAWENVDIHGVLYHVPRQERHARGETLLKLFELWDRRNDLVKTFSGGMRRRLEIARAIPVRPSSVPNPAKPDAIDLGAAAAADADAPAELRGDEVLDPASASGSAGLASSDGVGPLLAPAALLLDVAFRMSVGSFMLHPDVFCGLTCAASSSSSMWSVGSGGSFTPFSRPVPKLAR